MGLFDGLFRKKDAAAAPAASPAPAKSSGPRTHYFICTGNASLIEAHDSLLKPGVKAWNGQAGHYVLSSDGLESRIQEAQADGLVFGGHRYMGSSGTEVATVAEALRGMKVGSYGDCHVEYAAVDGRGVKWVREVYDTLLKEAVPQGILPYFVYITTDSAAAKFLLGSFTKVS